MLAYLRATLLAPTAWIKLWFDAGQRHEPPDLDELHTEQTVLPFWEQEEVRQMAKKTYSAGEIIIAEGTYGDQTFLIKSGTVEICKEAGRGKRISLAALKPGEVFGEMCLLDDTGFRSATVLAKTDVEVEAISRVEMEEYLASSPAIVRSILKTLSKRLADTSQEVSLLKYNQNWLSRFLK